MLLLIFKGIVYVLIFLTCTYIGMLKSKTYSERVMQLKNFKEALNVFKTKIKFTYEPIPQIFKEIGENTKGSIGEIFSKSSIYMNEEAADSSWRKAVEENGQMNITQEDKSVFLRLSRLLGQTDLEGQINEIELVDSFLNTQIEEAEDEKTKNEKLNKTLGMIAGLVIVILVI